MDIKKIDKFIASQIEDLEKATFMFETVVRPRYEADKAIIESLREQSLKVGTIMQKIEAGEEVTKEQIYDAIPPQFR